MGLELVVGGLRQQKHQLSEGRTRVEHGAERTNERDTFEWQDTSMRWSDLTVLAQQVLLIERHLLCCVHELLSELDGIERSVGRLRDDGEGGRRGGNDSVLGGMCGRLSVGDWFCGFGLSVVDWRGEGRSFVDGRIWHFLNLVRLKRLLLRLDVETEVDPGSEGSGTDEIRRLED
jgi:hypothetical protein